MFISRTHLSHTFF